MTEVQRCKDDFVYFANNYLKVETEDGIEPFVLTTIQLRLYKKFLEREKAKTKQL